MQIFNEINARKIHGERDVFSGIFTNPVFCSILIGTFVAQIFIVQFGGFAFTTTPLTASQWLWCVFLGMMELIWGQIVTSIPNRIIPKSFSFGGRKEVLPHPGDEEHDQIPDFTEDSNRRGQILWFRGLNRIQQQMSVVEAFKHSTDLRGKASSNHDDNSHHDWLQLQMLITPEVTPQVTPSGSPQLQMGRKFFFPQPPTTS